MLGFVVTFDDITELVAAQRTSAWADIARRIAHEIKNPLTPIQLSAERLKRKYLNQVTSDRETFIQCTDTIIRQVGDIGRMVDEFSAFARMPSPIFHEENLQDLGQQAIFMQQVSHSEISYNSDFSARPVTISCDRRQVAQALTNLLQNASDALTESAVKNGVINIRIFDEEGQAIIEVADNGPGLPTADRHRLTEPYVTNRSKGTGLGLAIVRKVMEDHGGRLILEDGADGGALVRLVFEHSVVIENAESKKAASHG
jgi:two-component system nitrogen regulation sensor histidine kinase NtrY